MARQPRNNFLFLVATTLIAFVLFANFHYFTDLRTDINAKASGVGAGDGGEQLRSVLENQDETIAVLTEQIDMLVMKLEGVDNNKNNDNAGYDSKPCAVPVEGRDSNTNTNTNTIELAKANSEIASLKSQVNNLKRQQTGASGGGSNNPAGSKVIMRTKHDEVCDATFGESLVKNYMQDPVEICRGGGSSITCYTHIQSHKNEPDVFCVGKEITIDFRKVKGTHTAQKPPRGNAQYHTFEGGSVSASCGKTANYNSVRFMPHMTLQMNTFNDNIATPTNAKRIEKTTYLLARDEDMEVSKER